MGHLSPQQPELALVLLLDFSIIGHLAPVASPVIIGHLPALQHSLQTGFVVSAGLS